MASNSKVFVSPGVYTSEVDLSFVAQSVGVTTLGIVGETLKGPAFEPIFIRNYDEFTTFFGDTSPEKFINTQIPKYEAAYIAKAYLQQSNQLFVTRVLGLSGYDAGPSWSITTKANVDPSTISMCSSAVTNYATCSGTTNPCGPCCVDTFDPIPFSFTFSACTDDVGNVQFLTSLDSLISNRLDLTYEKFDGSTSTLRDDINNQIFDVINATATTSTNINYFGVISGGTYDTLTARTASTNVFGLDSVDSDTADYSDPNNDPWYYALFDNNGNGSYSGFSFYSIVSSITLTYSAITAPTTTTTTTTNPCTPSTPSVTTTTTTPKPLYCYTGTVVGEIFRYTGASYTKSSYSV